MSLETIELPIVASPKSSGNPTIASPASGGGGTRSVTVGAGLASPAHGGGGTRSVTVGATRPTWPRTVKLRVFAVDL
ncbi:MAG: hypothetical protein FWG25_08435, partial [Promicromonosporaceae bacterium]|nr:hypothetical protein [Promicromonosporaceae bacterium]